VQIGTTNIVPIERATCQLCNPAYVPPPPEPSTRRTTRPGNYRGRVYQPEQHGLGVLMCFNCGGPLRDHWKRGCA
jgi:hypothetical protein